MKGIMMLMLVFLAGMNLVACEESTQTLKQKFQAAKKNFGQTFDQEEQFFRLKIFQANLKEIEDNNADPNSPIKKEVNSFIFWTEEEFQDNCLNGNMNPKLRRASVTIDDPDLNLAANSIASIDWRTSGKVTAIRNQGSCGSCYTFSTAGALESLSLIRDNKLLDLSEQQLLDCTSATAGYVSFGCNGGYPYYSFLYALNNGMTIEAKYPYQGKVTACRREAPAFKISSAHYTYGCNSLLQSIKTRPVAVGVEAVLWRYYGSGVWPSYYCASNIDHAVLLVGVTSQFWIIKNSWGAGWGQKGYIRLQMGNTCGICNYPAFYAR